MGFWAGIKYALNSTLGTKDFKPLDSQISDLQSLYASEDVYTTIGNGIAVSLQIDEHRKAYSKTVKYKYNIKMTSPGSCRFKISSVITSDENKLNQKAGFRIKKNGLEVNYKEHVVYNSPATSFVSDILFFQKNDVFSFEFYVYYPERDYNELIPHAAHFNFAGIDILGKIKQNVINVLEV